MQSLFFTSMLLGHLIFIKTRSWGCFSFDHDSIVFSYCHRINRIWSQMKDFTLSLYGLICSSCGMKELLECAYINNWLILLLFYWFTYYFYFFSLWVALVLCWIYLLLKNNSRINPITSNCYNDIIMKEFLIIKIEMISYSIL